MSNPAELLRCMVVDDDELFRSVMEHFIEQHDALRLAASCTSAVEAANFLQRERIDLLFLDVEMPEMSGLELLRNLRQRPQVVLVTGKEDYAVDAFDVEVTDYLLKPVNYARFLKAVERAQRAAAPQAPEAPDHIFVKTNGRLVKLDLKDILYVEAQGDYMLVQMPEERHLVHSTMKAIEDKLPAADFARVHRSYLVRIDQIRDIEETTLVIDRKVIPIGGTYRDTLLKRIHTL